MLDCKHNLQEILELAIELKAKQKKGVKHQFLKGKSLAMVFEKPSTRTRVSFEVGITQLGGHSLYLSLNDLQLKRGETISDTAKVLSRYVDGIIYRAFSHENVLELAKNSSVPIINGLDNLEHPCQIISDLLTIKEKKGNFRNLKLSYVGDGNNVCNSLLLGSAIVGMDISVGCPNNYLPNKEILKKAKKIAEKNKSNIEVIENPFLAVKNADIIYTDVWVSMGDEKEEEKRKIAFKDYQINKELVSKAKKNAIIMHCLPAHRGLEITDEVIDSKQSVVFEQAENRLHAQKGIMVELIK